MSVRRGPTPVYIALLAFTASLLWTPLAVAQQRVPLTIAEAEDLARAKKLKAMLSTWSDS